MPTDTFVWLMMVLNGPIGNIDHIPFELIQKHRPNILVIMKNLELCNRGVNWEDGWFKPNSTYATIEFLNMEFNIEYLNYQIIRDDLKTLHGTYNDLKDVPLCDSHHPFMIPSKECSERIRFCRSFRDKLEARIPWENDREDFYRMIIKECEECLKIWYIIDSININNVEEPDRFYQYYILSVRYGHKKLKELMPPDMYERGEFPPYVPDWRFIK